MSFFKSNNLASIKDCLVPAINLLCEYLKKLKSFYRDPLLKYFLINSESNLLPTLGIAS